MKAIGLEALPLFTEAQTLAQQGIDRAVLAQPAEFKRCVALARQIAATQDTLTIDDVRRAAGLLSSTGRDLAFLGAVMRAAGLKPTGEWRRSELPCTHGNLHRVYKAP